MIGSTGAQDFKAGLHRARRFHLTLAWGDWLVFALVFVVSMQVTNGVAADAGDGEVLFTVQKADDGKWGCTLNKSPAKRSQQQVKLKFEGAPESATVTVTWVGSTLSPFSPEMPGDSYTLNRPPTEGEGRIKAKVTLNISNNDRVECGEIVLFDALPSPFIEHDLEAFQWWMEQLNKDAKAQKTEHRKSKAGRGLKRNARPKAKDSKTPKQEVDKGEFFDLKESLGRKMKHYLVHLPSGAVAPPYPSDISEGARSQVVMIMPRTLVSAVTLKVKQCGIPATFRAKFDVEEDKPKSEAEMAREGTPKPAEPYVLQTVGPQLRCGPPTAEYDIESQLEIPGGDRKAWTTSQELRVNPKYHIAAIFAVGWDWAKRDEFFKERDPADPMDPNDTDSTKIGSRTVREGLIAYVGAQWMITGVDYHNMRWWNYFANPFFAVNIADPLRDFAAGLTLTPTGGISLAVGVTVHQRTVLDDGFVVGDTFEGEGDIPTSRRWENIRPGAFLGLTIDSNIYRALKSKFN